MKKRLFLYTTLIFFVGLLCFFAASVYITYNNNLRIAKDTVIETAHICAGLYKADTDPAVFVKAGSDTRITIIALDGRVLADSRPFDVEAAENHLSRPEIQAAASGSPAAYIRHSDTLGVNFIYYALQVDSGDGAMFVRAAIPVAKVDAYLLQFLPPLAFLLLLIAVLCFILFRGVIRRITRPFASLEHRLQQLSSGVYTPEPIARSYEEIDAITQEIDEVARVLQHNIISLRDEMNKVEYLLNNINDGIFAVNEHRSITLINAAALAIFDVTQDIVDKNMNYLTYDKALTAAVDDCVAHGKNTLLEFAYHGRIYLATVKELPETKLVMVILSDITDSRENEKRREEFFANASHELKTPLTAIKGFNELTAINNQDENLGRYIESITRETDRMLSLIGDMLELSELENARRGNPVPVSLGKAMREACETLSAAIGEKSITLDISGDGLVEAEPAHVYELIKNLVENAVRYNNPKGHVSLSVESDRRHIWLLVFDNGIGISPGEQARIFERFYRVEKSRSQRSGGTGLGLSIVKHICALYGWELSLKSRPGVGTEIKVVFGQAATTSAIPSSAC